MRRAALGAALLGACGAAAAAASGAAVWPFPGGAHPVVTVIGDSVIATGLPSGRTTLTATRPDALTGKPVTIGRFVAGAALSSSFAVNTTGPSLVRPTGDCWQKGALKTALTPDLLQGDKLVFTATGMFDSPSTTTVTVGAPVPGATPGPVPACANLSPWARNAVTGVPDPAGGSSATVSGVAQAFATSVSLTATDGSATTDPVEVTPDADGKWSATLQLGPLASGEVTVAPVFAVPDAGNGETAHVAGPKVALTKD
jgi:hypothetical protein